MFFFHQESALNKLYVQMLAKNSFEKLDVSMLFEDFLTLDFLVVMVVMVLITYYNSYIQLNYHMFTSNIGTITTVLNLSIYLHCQIVFYIY